jgi:hypothetical protein
MRTTLTLDDDVAAQIEQLRKARDLGLKDVVNEALRRGLKEMSAKPKRRQKFETRVHHGGKPYIDNIDNVAEVLALIEGDNYR